MATLLIHRLLIVIPVARTATVVNWFTANIGADSVPADFGPALNPSGKPVDPITHRWCSGAWTDGAARVILRQLCQMAGVVPPTLGQWNGWTRAEKIDWLKSIRANLWSGDSIWVAFSMNDGAWDDSIGERAGRGLSVIIDDSKLPGQ